MIIKGNNPNRTVVLGYFLYVLIGSLLLLLPFFEKIPIKYLDNLFIATSAVSTTGLATISISDCYNFWGQLIVIILIQLGGIGYMTLGSFIILAITDKIDLSRNVMHKYVLSIPEHINTRKIIKIIICYTFIVEFIGTIFLFVFFKIAKVSNALWSAIFHSVSAFCTAGFSLYNNSLESFHRNIGINFTISVLCILGSIGFIIVYDIWNESIKEKRSITLTSKIILRSTFLLITLGTIVLFFFEPIIIRETFFERMLTSFFQSMTSLTTAGFNTIPISNLTMLSYLVITMLMIIGASPSGTGGGLKTTTFTTLIGVMKSSLKGEKDVRFLNRTIPNERVWLAISSLFFYLTLLFISTFPLFLKDNRFLFHQVLFEVASALGTVGLSTGITQQLNNFEKIIIIITMFIGRIGPLSFGISLFLKKRPNLIKYPTEDLAI